MIDREKVIRGLELCAYDPDPGQELKEIRSCPECPYYRDGCSSQLIRDALALLKEQEGVKPIGGYGFYFCGVCKNSPWLLPLGPSLALRSPLSPLGRGKGKPESTAPNPGAAQAGSRAEMPGWPLHCCWRPQLSTVGGEGPGGEHRWTAQPITRG